MHPVIVGAIEWNESIIRAKDRGVKERKGRLDNGLSLTGEPDWPVSERNAVDIESERKYIGLIRSSTGKNQNDWWVYRTLLISHEESGG